MTTQTTHEHSNTHMTTQINHTLVQPTKQDRNINATQTNRISNSLMNHLSNFIRELSIRRGKELILTHVRKHGFNIQVTPHELVVLVRG